MKLPLKSPLFLYLLPLFFVLHGFMENYDFVPVKDALLLTAMYIGFSILFLLLFWLLFRDFTKAAIAASYIMAFHFFFGGIHDLLKKVAQGSFASKYMVLTGAAFIIFVLLLIVLKKRKKTLHSLAYYLNILLLVLLLIDTGMLVIKMINKKKYQLVTLPEGFVSCATCPKPDIYFIIADEYVGNSTLTEQFNFDNSAFVQELANRGFHTIPYSRSNYNFTPFSVASMLDMRYPAIGSGNMNVQSDLALCYETIRNNRLLRFLQYEGYQFYNYSIFNFEGQPARVEVNFLPIKTKLITSQTFLSRFDRDIRFNLVTRFKSASETKRLTYGFLHNNENNYRLTMKAAETTGTKPKFVLTHLHIPHYPYYFDKNGKEQPFEKLTEGNQVNKEMYVEYLQYGNKKYLELIDHIMKTSKQPPVIILVSDHGFRHFTNPVDPKYYYLNHASVLLPDRQYAAFTDSLTNVNFSRVFLNTVFKQQLLLLADSTIYIRE